MEGLVKLFYSSCPFNQPMDVGMRVVEDPAILTKSAATIFECDYSDMQPDADHVGIHVVALGDFEHYGSNRNGDSFPKKACVGYHDTFVKNGSLFRHHRNKDREKRLGQIVKSAYNDSMGRIELFVHAHREKARDELQKLATDGEIPFSMACKVAFDRCNRCGTLRRNKYDPNQCDHVRQELGKLAEDGTITATHNDEPNFFDISFVGRPADRIAWDMWSDVKAAAAAKGEMLTSVKMAEVEGLWVPDHIAITSPSSLTKLAHMKKMAEMTEVYERLNERGAHTSFDRYVWELRKSGAAALDDETLEELRQHEPETVFAGLAKVGVVLDVDSFFKYAMGLDFGDIAVYMDGVRQAVPQVFKRLVKVGTCQDACNSRTFDVDMSDHVLDRVPHALMRKIAECRTLIGSKVDERVITRTIYQDNPHMALDSDIKIGFNTDSTMELLAEKYAAYKLSALDAVIQLHKDTDTDALFAMATTQDLFN